MSGKLAANEIAGWNECGRLLEAVLNFMPQN